MAKGKNLDQIVKDLINESMFRAFFFSIGINALKQAVDQWDDETVVKHFGGLWSAGAVRKQIQLMDDRFPKLWCKILICILKRKTL